MCAKNNDGASTAILRLGNHLVGGSTNTTMHAVAVDLRHMTSRLSAGATFDVRPRPRAASQHLDHATCFLFSSKNCVPSAVPPNSRLAPCAPMSFSPAAVERSTPVTYGTHVTWSRPSLYAGYSLVFNAVVTLKVINGFDEWTEGEPVGGVGGMGSFRFGGQT